MNFFTTLPLEVEDRGAVGEDDGAAFGAVEDHADFGALVFAGFQAADLEDQCGFIEFVHHYIGVGRFAGVFVAPSAAVGRHPPAEAVFAQSPAGDVHLMDALVADVAAAVGPLPVPIVMELLARFSGRIGAGPLQSCNRRSWGLRTVPRGPIELRRFVAERVGEFHFADFAGVNIVDCLNDARMGRRLRARLADFIELPRRFDHAAAFADRVTDGFFDVNVFARLHGPKSPLGRANGLGVAVVTMSIAGSSNARRRSWANWGFRPWILATSSTRICPTASSASTT